MARKKKYEIEVIFSTPIYVTVYAEDIDDAMETAEYHATKEFRKNLDSGMYGVGDFNCEAQTP